MDNIQERLVRCFSAVFPDLPAQHIATASVESIPGWDSVAAATLITTIEEEFAMEFNAEALGTLTSYNAIYSYLSALSGTE